MDDAKQILAYGVFPALSVVGFSTTMLYGWRNGLVESLSDIASGRKQDLPMTKSRVIRKWTGIGAIDYYLSFYLAFFLPGLGRATPNTTLQNRHFIGQFTAMWTLIQLQANRKESSALIQASMLATGFGIQTVAAATVVPLFCAIHLATSVISKPGSFGSISESRTAAIPPSVVLSILVPLLTSTSVRSPWPRQAAINVWQLFFLLSIPLEKYGAPLLQHALDTGVVNLPLSTVYSFAEGLSAVTHIFTIGVALATKVVPNLFPNGFAKSVSFKTMFWPRLTLEKPGDMVEARLHLLRWDEWVACSTFLIWATFLYVAADPTTSYDYKMLAGRILWRVVLTGPIGAAAHLLRERDMILMKP